MENIEGVVKLCSAPGRQTNGHLSEQRAKQQSFSFTIYFLVGFAKFEEDFFFAGPFFVMASFFPFGADHFLPTPPSSSSARLFPSAVPALISAALMNSHHSSRSTIPPPLSSIFSKAAFASDFFVKPSRALNP